MAFPVDVVAQPALLRRCWQLRHDLSAYDAQYVALAEAFRAVLVTTDGRLARAPGLACPIEVFDGNLPVTMKSWQVDLSPDVGHEIERLRRERRLDNGPVISSMVRVPPGGAVTETVVDRRTGRSWSVDVPPFEIATTVVTVGQWNIIHPDGRPEAGFDLPKVDVSWRDALTFCNALSRHEGLRPPYTITQVARPERATTWRPHHEPAPDSWLVEWDRTADGYRLPTDAEWQVACRAGTSGPRHGDLADIGWYAGNSGGALQPVAGKAPNTWGLYDTLGGVWEWCWDLYDEAVYGSYRIIRGGGWNDPEWSCRAGVRRKTNPQAAFDDLGFRVARTPPPVDDGDVP